MVEKPVPAEACPGAAGTCRIIPQAGRTSREARLADGSLSAASETDHSARKARAPLQ